MSTNEGGLHSISLQSWSQSRPNASEEFSQVIALSKSNKKTLGFLPDQAFSQRALHDGLIIAVERTQVVGYALYDLPRSHIKLIHVCVDPPHRGTGLSSELVLHVIGLNQGRTGILAACRADYGIDSFWKKLGMTSRSEKAGRSIKGSILRIWWRPLGQLDLFEAAALHSPRPTAVLDSNIVIDLYASDSVSRPDREQSLALLGNWLEDEVAYMVSPEMDNEFSRTTDASEQAIQRGGAAALPRLRTSRPTDSQIESALTAFVGSVEIARDVSLLSDVRHIADAVRADARYFVTNDGNLMRLLREHVEVEYQLTILRPHELVAEFITEPDSPVFSSDLLESINLSWRPVQEIESQSLVSTFLNYSERERDRDFQRQLRESLAHRNSGNVDVLVDEQNRMFALLATRRDEHRLTVTMVRTVRDKRGSTVAFQLVRHLRRVAYGQGLSSVVVVDSQLRGPVLEALALDGFVETPDGPTASLWDSVSTDELPMGALNSAETIAAVEKRFWPLTILDDLTECWVSPIRPAYAQSLFNFGQTLFSDRPLALGLSREHVYYRSGKRPIFGDLPARILWFASGAHKNDVRAIVARSRVIQSEILPTAEAFERFKHIGVYRRDQVESAANKQGMVHVIRFEDTELLDHPVSRTELRPILERHGVQMPFLTLRQVPNGVFHDVMALQGPRRSVLA